MTQESLLEKQMRFQRMTCLLFQFAQLKGYGLTYGDAFRDVRCTYGHRFSLHRIRLALDLNLFKRDDKGRWQYLTSTDAHEELGEFWESIGGTWGGRFGDGNHYSLEHEGIK